MLSIRCRLPAAMLLLVLAIGGLAQTAAGGEGRILVDPVEMLSSAERRDFSGENSFTVEHTEVGACLRSVPQRSASGLYQSVSAESNALRRVSWRWRVDEIHSNADIRMLGREDFAAKIAFVFGEPSIFKRDVPTLAYVWTSTPVRNGTVIPSSRYRNLRYVQLHGTAEVGSWQIETRDIIADFVSVFGQEPEPLGYIALFNDNDQTGEQVSALFGSVRSLFIR